MTRPDSVRLGTLIYRVIADPDKIREVSDEQDIDPQAEWAAYSDHDALVIAINGTQPAANQKRDLLHEVLHCCLRYSGVEPNAYARIVARAKGRHGGYTVEEFMVAATAAPLLAVLVDNPHLTAWLTTPEDHQ